MLAETIPAAYLQRMRKLLGDEYPAYLRSLDEKPKRGVRVNTLKCTVEEFLQVSPFALTPSPFAPEGFYLDGECTGAGNTVQHHLGLFYMQEPSAMSAVQVLDPQPGERVLDLCAAPGGKSTQIAAKLQGTGLLWSNEVVLSRAKVLLSNMERMGVRNAVVSSAKPDTIAAKLVGYFDKVLVDAPCSGEGMLRKEPQAALDWSEENIRACAARQLAILESAKACLRPGGVLVYSTCTFSLEENERTILQFLERNADFELLPIDVMFGRMSNPAWIGRSEQPITHMRRVMPADGGEGHFIAKLRKRDDAVSPCCALFDYALCDCPESFGEFARTQFISLAGSPHLVGGTVYLLPDEMPLFHGAGVLRAGVRAGCFKGKRFEPAHHLYVSQRMENLLRPFCMELDDPAARRFLHGEQLEAPGFPRGYTGVCIGGYPAGFGKVSADVLKNHYPKGLRSL